MKQESSGDSPAPPGIPVRGRCSRSHESSHASLNEYERNELVLEHLLLVKAIAAKCRLRWPSHLEFSDLVQAGVVGLLDAAHRYDPESEVSFSSYATHRIKGAILDSLRDQDPAPRKLRRKGRDIERVRFALLQELERCPTEHEISERSGIDIENLRQTELDIHHLNQMSLSECDSGRGELCECDGPVAQPDSIYQDRERAQLVNELVSKLPAAYRMVIVMHYATELPLKQIGGSFGVPERQVSRMHKQALQRINALLRAKGIRARADL